MRKMKYLLGMSWSKMNSTWLVSTQYLEIISAATIFETKFLVFFFPKILINVITKNIDSTHLILENLFKEMIRTEIQMYEEKNQSLVAEIENMANQGAILQSMFTRQEELLRRFVLLHTPNYPN